MSRWVLACEFEGPDEAAHLATVHLLKPEVRDALGRAAEMVGLELIGSPSIVPIEPTPPKPPEWKVP